MILYDFLQAKPLPNLLDECRGVCDHVFCTWCTMLKKEEQYQRHMSESILTCIEDLKKVSAGLLIILVFLLIILVFLY
jgi:hypothetical protein